MCLMCLAVSLQRLTSVSVAISISRQWRLSDRTFARVWSMACWHGNSRPSPFNRPQSCTGRAKTAGQIVNIPLRGEMKALTSPVGGDTAAYRQDADGPSGGRQAFPSSPRRQPRLVLPPSPCMRQQLQRLKGLLLILLCHA